MIRLFNVYYPTRVVVLLAGECLVVCASFLLATLLRLGEDSMLVLEYQAGFYKILAITVVAVLCLDLFDLYDLQRVPTPGETYFRILVVLGVLAFVLAGVSYLFPNLALGNGVAVAGLFILTLALLGWRSGYAWLVRQPFLRERVFVLGTGERARSLVDALRQRPELGLDVIGWSGTTDGALATRQELAQRVVDMVEGRRVARIIVSLEDRRGRLPLEELLQLKSHGVLVQDGSDLYEALTGKVLLNSLRLSSLLFARGFRVSRVLLVYKRIVSFTLSLVGLFVSLPVMALIALAIGLDSEGPVLFRQERVGKDGKAFKLTKFRSMRVGSDADGQSRPAQENDERLTRVGRWLRKTRLDELPQLYNILRGDMYFVGPRPFVPSQEEECARKIPFYRQRWTVKPGATGWAQVNRGYCATVEDNEEKLAYDLFYIKNVSIGLDLLILFRTVKILLLGRGAR